MSFKRKFWKRGDRLTAKELNRLEEGIYEAKNAKNTSSTDDSSGIAFINISGSLGDSLTITNIDLTVEEFNELCAQQKPAILKCNCSLSEDETMNALYYSPFVHYGNEELDNETKTTIIGSILISSEDLFYIFISLNDQKNNIESIVEHWSYTVSVKSNEHTAEPEEPSGPT